jgi:hypothetical protein
MTGALENSRLAMTDAHRTEIEAIGPIIRALAALPSESRPLHLRVVKDLLWVVTEFRPSFPHKVGGVRWRTPAAHELVLRRESKTIRHEHVVERDWMARVLLDHPEVAHLALWQYPCALVTKDEHDSLAKNAWGWWRYVDSRTEVVDGENGRAIDVRAMAEALDDAYEELGLRSRS